ncbi:DUF4241 domain-containing protein [Streptomyces sp. NPDC005426]|uniref:DUF4241 domain-containing protein n=1 Tax=Streptomyces sp. NPDC005426 TaxID=3155344 RepID=UPI0033B4A2E6
MDAVHPAMDVIYCEGWDAAECAVVEPISPAEASARDQVGEKYAVLLAIDGSPSVLIEVAWGNHACLVWKFDPFRRRTLKRDIRQLGGGRLVLVEEILWAYSDEQQNEFDRGVPTRISQIQGGGTEADMMVITDQARTSMSISPDLSRLQRPAFGDWASIVGEGDSIPQEGPSPVWPTFSGEAYVALLHEALSYDGYWRPIPLFIEEPPSYRLTDAYPTTAGISVSFHARPLWEPPHPLQPDPTFLQISRASREVCVRGQLQRLKSIPVGRLRLPSGRLIACDPDDYFLEEKTPYTATAPPGEYRFFVNICNAPNSTIARIAAGGILVRDEEVASWELAVLPGEDTRLLPNGAAYGFGVDSGMACFFDASFLPTIVATFSENDHPLVCLDLPGIRVSRFGGTPESAALIAFDSGMGDGRYPVWIGRGADGGVACIVADMQLDKAQ